MTSFYVTIRITRFVEGTALTTLFNSKGVTIRKAVASV